MRYTLSLLALDLSSAGLSAHAVSSYSNYPEMNMDSSCVSLEVVSGNSALAPIDFNRQTWVEGRPGAEYTLVARNSCPFRVLAVLSVDGLDVLSGDKASFNSRGYVIDSGSSAQVEGWRKNNDQVAAFFFSSPSGSYAERVGKGGNVGVIGAAFFQEVPAPIPYPYPPERARRESMNSDKSSAMPGSPPPSANSMAAPGMRSMPAPQDPSLGTGHGRRIDSSVTTTSFNRMATPFSTVSIRYESTQKLQEMGAIAPPYTGPNPFPAQPEPSYVPDPPPYRRY
jgi:hypothetical protein